MADPTPELANKRSAVPVITGGTIVFMVLLRILIGWHLFYEGAWKLSQDSWTARGFLVQSAGPLQDVFRGMVPDENGLEALTEKAAMDHLYTTRDHMIRLYEPNPQQMRELGMQVQNKEWYIKGLFATGEARVDYLEQIVREQADLAKKLDEAKPKLDELNKRKQEILDAGDKPEEDKAYQEEFGPIHEMQIRFYVVLPGARAMFLREMNDADNPDSKAQVAAFEELVKADIAAGDDNNKAAIDAMRAELAPLMGDSDLLARLDAYKELLHRLDKLQKGQTSPDFKAERLQDLRGRKAKMKASMIAKVYAGSKDLPKRSPIGAGQYFTAKQLAAGPVPPDKSPTWLIDWANMISLTVVGACLMLGLFTRLAALGGAGLLLMYYMAYPPWPGVMPNPMEPASHYFIVDTKLIEVTAMLMFAFSRVGRWGGLDALLFSGTRKESADA